MLEIIREDELKKIWWTTELTELWNELCIAEKHMLRSNGQTRRLNRESFKVKRKTFDRCVQRAKKYSGECSKTK